MNNDKWWSDNDLPPPSMRKNHTHNFHRYFSPSSSTSAQFQPQNYQPEETDRILEQRSTNLNMDKNIDQVETLSSLEERAKMLRRMNGESQETPSVSEIEQRLAKLCELPVEDIKYPRSIIINGNKAEEETAEKLIRRARDEAALERDWNCAGKSEDMQVNPEEFLKVRRSDAFIPNEMNEEILTSDMGMMGQDTIRNLKQIQRTMKLAKQRSAEVAELAHISNDNRSMDKEIEELMKLANRSNKRSEKITDELSKFWKTRLHYETSSSESSSRSENPEDEAEIDCEELQRVILEAEEAENEAMQMVKEAKKNDKKSSILSRIFRPR